jgi:hypothetical protein
LAKDAYSRPPIIIKFHNLHANDIREVVGEIVSTTRGTSSLPSLVLIGCVSFGLSLAFPFVFGVMVLAIRFFFDFLDSSKQCKMNNLISHIGPSLTARHMPIPETLVLPFVHILFSTLI